MDEIANSRLRKTLHKVLCVCGVLGSLMTSGCTTPPILAFGIVADVQYADKDKVGTRQYRRSMDKLVGAVSDFNDRKLAFVVQLGDIIDGGAGAEADLRTIACLFNGIQTKKYHVLGNHDFSGIDRKTTMSILGMKRAFYDFAYRKWRFVVLDTMDLAVAGGWDKDSLNYTLGKEMLDELAAAGKANAVEWNGAIGPAQKEWLEYILKDAQAKKQKVIVFGHNPLMPAGDRYNLWNSGEIVKLLESYDGVVAYFNGHKHFCEYYWVNNKYYVTIDGMVEDAFDRGYAVANVYKDRIVIQSTGKTPHLTLLLE
ncbi:MAG: hypothetical protein DRP66_02085 [Planctomycetota bacterium]|nr:MAG: hypothetical protein DRP66_02085 [Planctomycetota bacterium]